MIQPRGLEDAELEELAGQDVTIVAVGSDGFVVRMPDDKLVAVSICMGCGQHLAYYEIDEDMIVDDSDIAAS